MEKYIELSNLIFPDIDKTVEDLELRYPKRNIAGEVVRFAPSPTGFLHTGALFTSLIVMMIAKQTDGVFYLRIEDTDRKREVEGGVSLITDGLKNFGIIPDEGVISETEEIGDYGPYTQSKREEIYKICAKYLIAQGLAYPCFCTTEMLDNIRSIQEKSKQITGYYGNYARCRNLSVDEMIEKVKNKEKFVIRLKSNGNHFKKINFVDLIKGKIDIAQNDQDAVIIKSDNLPTYHFAHVVDDHFMRTTTVLRGEEWLPSAPLHVELFEKMGFELPAFAHLSSVMVQDGVSKRKLSKRKDKAAAVEFLLKSGYPKEAVIEYILTIVNSNFEPWRMANPDKNINEFELKLNKISSSGALLDMLKLNDISKECISKYTSKELLDNSLEWAKKFDMDAYDILNKDLDYTLKIFGIERDNAKKIRKDIIKYEDIMENFMYFYDELFSKDIENGYNFELDFRIINKVITNYKEIYSHSDDKDTWFSKIKEIANINGFCTDMKEYKQNPDKYIGSTADVAGIIRIAITNRKNTPDLYNIMQVLGEKTVMDRLDKSI